MKKRYVARDKAHPKGEKFPWYAAFVHPPVLEDGVWQSNDDDSGDYEEITKAEAEELVGRPLKKGECVRRY